MAGIPAVSHVLPSLDVIRELVDRGHRVTYANDPAVAGLVSATGAEFVPVTSTLPVADNRWPEDPIAVMELFLDEAVQALPQLRAVHDADPADLYLYDIGAYAARALAERQGRPLVQLSPTFVFWEGADTELTGPLKQLPGYAGFEAKFAQWLASCGATTKEVDRFSGRPPRALALIPEAMQPHAGRVDRQVSFVGPCLGQRAEQGEWRRPAGAERVLLVSLGSAATRQPEFYRQCVAAFGGLDGWHVVLQIGKYVDPAVLGTVPSNVEVHSWVPQLAVLAQADAFVTHAGMGSCGEGLHHGLPMIAVPQAAEQFLNADRLVELGVARRVNTAEATAEVLRTTLLELVSDGEVAKRAAELRDRTRALGGTSRAADLIEAELR
ncbi:macrolide family glycosyltransferase [Streptomyces orinoci]|nr:macrolide family glycosyltransferase [Streptomyces orinoci]